MILKPDMTEDKFSTMPDNAILFNDGNKAPEWIKQREFVFRRDDVIDKMEGSSNSIWSEPITEDLMNDLDELYAMADSISNKFNIIIHFDNYAKE